jgi:hypothetical protein
LNFDTDVGPVSRDLFEEAPGPSLARELVDIAGSTVTRITGEFWTAAQRQASSLHEVAYRACFKPQLPGYFIKRFAPPGSVVYDPYSGRGTTAIEAALMGRRVAANDVNPLSAILARARLAVPDANEVARRLERIPYRTGLCASIDLSMFYDPATESEIVSLREYLRARRAEGAEDPVDAWIRMVATNRLTGHSAGFFSVYTFPPNQAVSAASQVKINARRAQAPTYRDTRAIILKKTRQLLSGLTGTDLARLREAAASAVFLTGPANDTPAIADSHVSLTVTSPPFLDVVQYAEDNWLRCWFNDLPLETVAARMTVVKTVEAWEAAMGPVFAELYRITAPGGVVAFEVGEVKKGRVRLEEHVIPVSRRAGFACEAVLIHAQRFTKTANIWGISNNARGTNSNRIVVLRKAER